MGFPAETKSDHSFHVTTTEHPVLLVGEPIPEHRDLVITFMQHFPPVAYCTDVYQWRDLSKDTFVPINTLGILEITGIDLPVILVGPKDTIAKTNVRPKGHEIEVTYPLESGGVGFFVWSNSENLDRLVDFKGFLDERNIKGWLKSRRGLTQDRDSGARFCNGKLDFSQRANNETAQFCLIGLKCGWNVSMYNRTISLPTEQLIHVDKPGIR